MYFMYNQHSSYLCLSYDVEQVVYSECVTAKKQGKKNEEAIWTDES